MSCAPHTVHRSRHIVHVETFVNDSFFPWQFVNFYPRTVVVAVVVVVFIHGKFMCSSCEWRMPCVRMSVVYLGLRTKTDWTFDFRMTFVKYLNGFWLGLWYKQQITNAMDVNNICWTLYCFEKNCLDDMTHDQWACPLSMLCRRTTTVLLLAILIVYGSSEESERGKHTTQDHTFFSVICLVLLSFLCGFV